MNNFKRIIFSLSSLMMLSVFVLPAEAKLCFHLVNNVKVFKFVGTPTQYLVKKVSSIPACLTEPPYPTQELIDPSMWVSVKSLTESKCYQTAIRYCDPNWQGVRVLTTPEYPSNNSCLGLKISSSASTETSAFYYANPQLYDASNADGSCRFDAQ